MHLETIHQIADMLFITGDTGQVDENVTVRPTDTGSKVFFDEKLVMNYNALTGDVEVSHGDFLTEEYINAINQILFIWYTYHGDFDFPGPVISRNVVSSYDKSALTPVDETTHIKADPTWKKNY